MARAEWFDGKTCEWCGTSESLEIDHTNPGDKISHRVFSWTRERRDAELAKCRVLCRWCHRENTNRQIAESGNTAKHAQKLTGESAIAVFRAATIGREHYKDIADRFGICERHVSLIANGHVWSSVTAPLAVSLATAVIGTGAP